MTTERKRKLQAITLATAMMASLSGCSNELSKDNSDNNTIEITHSKDNESKNAIEEANCEIKELHAHIYTSEDLFDQYMVSEDVTFADKWVRTDDYLLINEEEERLIEFENDNCLFRICLNKSELDEITNGLADHLQYRYEYETTVPYDTGNEIKEEKVICYSWTANPNNKKITGETRTAHFMYFGYKIEKNNDGEYELVQSDLVESIDDLLENGYTYVKNHFYVLTDSLTKEVLSFEEPNFEVMYEDYSRGNFDPKIIFNGQNINKAKTKVLSKRI